MLTALDENGLTEINSPVLVRDEAMYGTDKLPKFSEDSFSTSLKKVGGEVMWQVVEELNRKRGSDVKAGFTVKETDHEFWKRLRETWEEEARLWLIPTAEVSLTASVMGDILGGASLPAKNIVPPGFFGYVEGLEADAYDPEQAQALLAAAGYLVLEIWVNRLTALLTLASLVGYAMVYTMYLKRATPQNIVIGGLAGAAPPLLGWTAITGEIHPYALLLVLIIFIWTPPHFWALAIHREKDYARAQVPMLPVTHGVAFTKTSVLLYTILLAIVCLMPYLVGMTGVIYFIGSSLLNVGFLYYALKLKFNADEHTAMQTFRFSILHLMVLFLVLLVDHYFKITL